MDGTSVTKKTPADFTEAAATYHEDLDVACAALSKAQLKLDDLAERRIGMVADARDYGLTAAYARTLLRKP